VTLTVTLTLTLILTLTLTLTHPDPTLTPMAWRRCRPAWRGSLKGQVQHMVHT